MNAPFIVPTSTSASWPFDALRDVRFAIAFLGFLARVAADFFELPLRFFAADLLRVELDILRSPSSTELFRRPQVATPDSH